MANFKVVTCAAEDLEKTLNDPNISWARYSIYPEYHLDNFDRVTTTYRIVYFRYDSGPPFVEQD